MVRTVVNSCDGAVIGCSASIQLSDHHTCIWWIFTVNPMWNSLPLSLYHTLFHSISPMDKIFRYKNCHSDESDAIILKQEALHSLQIPWKKVPKGFIQNRFSLHLDCLRTKVSTEHFPQFRQQREKISDWSHLCDISHAILGVFSSVFIRYSESKSNGIFLFYE